MVDLNTTYLGLELKNPIVASSSPLTQKPETAVQLEEAGVSALVMHSLFEEQIIRESLKLNEDLLRGSESFYEASNFLPNYGQFKIGPESYLDTLKSVKDAVTIPVLGSLNGVSTGGWVDYARRIEDTGADGLELNIYYLSTDINMPSNQLEDRYIDLVLDIRRQVQIPLAIKLSPFFTALPNFVEKLSQVGVNGLVLFNRFYQPDFDLENLEVVPNLVLSNSNEIRMPLRWIAMLHGRVSIDLAMSGGVHTGLDVLKAMMAGAKVTTIASAFLQNGVQWASKIQAEMVAWMEDHEYESIKQMQGSMSQKSVEQPDAFERVNYMKALSSY
ncbi:MAG: dihydroorotate dehydrogenase [Anaerolineae bacterium UTCFX2]|jgi:dihydroorotate dehydrogenase (fumarate)|nr:dihydroorotate dehydrogenase-like protein [Anaerolineales bacterium]OQY87611.1 MAG: dihydroorotate dehydrogenase [Anaerolineae bacterium UTCFX2]